MSEAKSTRLATIPESDTSGPPQVISIGLWRMGTASMAAAYNILGLRPHHALDMAENPKQWELFEAAADGTWPDPRTGKLARPPFTREEWDKIYGKYGAITELGSAFAEQLIAAYPEAKVVICRRDFDKWWPSFVDGIADPLWSFQCWIAVNIASPLVGHRGGHTMIKTVSGFFGVKTRADFDKKTKAAYDDYFRRIDELLPPERKLHYRLGEGWEPLCKFLGKPIPDVEFPRLNEAESHKKQQQKALNDLYTGGWNVVKPWLLAAVGVGAAIGLVRYANATGLLDTKMF